MQTDILPVNLAQIGVGNTSKPTWIHEWQLDASNQSQDAEHLRRAAHELRTSNSPVAFPTETVYGLGADATRSAAVQGIYKAKQRPSDNPLIVHVWSLDQVRELLAPGYAEAGPAEDPIPAIYTPLITKFWPGPLTLIVPNPANSRLAPEVTAGLSTFGVRMPRNPHALALLKLANVPLAAPSANASTKPSPTEAEHVKYDLDGRISTIIDGGACDVGVESTVVDGLSSPPSILRPGGISIEQLNSCPGWEDVVVGYKDNAQSEAKPRAPGMKYKHYSPKAPVVLYEHTRQLPTQQDIQQYLGQTRRIGVIRTMRWPHALGLEVVFTNGTNGPSQEKPTQVVLHNDNAQAVVKVNHFEIAAGPNAKFELLEVDIGQHATRIAQGLFSALRALDKSNVDAIFVEGVNDSLGDVSAAVMNRLRKAAEVKIRD